MTIATQANAHAARAGFAPLNLAGDGLILLALMAVAFLLRLAFWPGLLEFDDAKYAQRALEIVGGAWLPSGYVGDLRYGVNLPVAFSMALFGPSDFALRLWGIVCSLGEIALIYVLAHSIWDRPTAVCAGILAALCPLHLAMGGIATLADAPLGFFITLTFASFYFAEKTGSRALYLLSGAALGFAWWIKPPALLTAAVFAVYAFALRRLRREWLLVAVAAAAVIGTEWVMFWIAFGDPFYALHAFSTTLDRDFIRRDAPAGDHSAFFYFRMMFRDGRDMVLVPLFALVGAGLLVRNGEWKDAKRGGYVLIWGLALLCVLSFFPYSLSPFKIIPKQDNYALMFAAPLFLLAGYGVARLPGAVRWPALTVYVIAALALSALVQHGVQVKAAAIRAALQIVDQRRDEEIYGSAQLQNLVRLKALQTGVPQPAIRPLGSLDQEHAPREPQEGRATIAIVMQSGELGKDPRWRALDRSNPCWRPIQRFAPEVPDSPGAHLLAWLGDLQPKMPRLINNQLSFAYRMREREPVRVFLWSRECRAGGANGKRASAARESPRRR